MAPSALICLLLLLISTRGEAARREKEPQEELSLAVAEGTLTLRFDSARISRETLKSAIQVSPEADIPGLGVLLEACDPKDREYADCTEAKPGTKGYLRNATINVNRAVVKLRKVRALELPKSLKEPHAFFKRNGIFYVWLLKTQLEFLRTGQVRVLKRELGDIKPREVCEAALERVDAAPTGDKAFKIVRTDWYNCVNHVFNERIGKYPRKAWDAFLAAHGIREKLDTK